MPKCELMENCSFYWNYRMHPDSLKRNLITRYCHSGELPEKCARIIYARKYSEPPHPGITPEGDYLKEIQIESHIDHQSAHHFCES